MEATDLSGALLWRAHGKVKALTAIRLPDAPETWRPSWTDDHGTAYPWNDKAYQDLRQTMESLPPGAPRDSVLHLIRSLDCANPDPRLASCDPSVQPPPEAAAWRKSLEDAGVDDAAYAKALAAALKTLVCTGGEDAAYILRGLLSNNRIKAAGPEAPALVDAIMSKDCPVSASLTDADKAKLQDAIGKTGG